MKRYDVSKQRFEICDIITKYIHRINDISIRKQNNYIFTKHCEKGTELYQSGARFFDYEDCETGNMNDVITKEIILLYRDMKIEISTLSEKIVDTETEEQMESFNKISILVNNPKFIEELYKELINIDTEKQLNQGKREILTAFSTFRSPIQELFMDKRIDGLLIYTIDKCVHESGYSKIELQVFEYISSEYKNGGLIGLISGINNIFIDPIRVIQCIDHKLIHNIYHGDSSNIKSIILNGLIYSNGTENTSMQNTVIELISKILEVYTTVPESNNKKDMIFLGIMNLVNDIKNVSNEGKSTHNFKKSMMDVLYENVNIRSFYLNNIEKYNREISEINKEIKVPLI